MKSLLLLALGLARTVVLGARIEAERIVVSVRPYKREQRRCPVCVRACDFYDMANRGAPRCVPSSKNRQIRLSNFDTLMLTASGRAGAVAAGPPAA